MTRSLDQALIQGADVSALSSANLLVNGFMNISQENGDNAIAIASNSSAYIVDQWVLNALTGGAMSGQRVATPFQTMPNLYYGLKGTVTTAVATPAAAELLCFNQRLEGIFLHKTLSSDGTSGPYSIAFMARANIDCTIYARLVIGTGANARAHLKRVALKANTDTFVSYQTGKDTVQNTACAFSMTQQGNFMISLASGANNLGPGEGWVAGSGSAASDITNFGATVGNSIIIGGAVVVSGQTPISQAMLPLLARPYDDELRKCARYFETGFCTELFIVNVVGQFAGETKLFSEKKRAIPTMILSGSTTNTGEISADNATVAGFRLFITTSVTGNGGYSTNWFANARM